MHQRAIVALGAICAADNVVNQGVNVEVLRSTRGTCTLTGVQGPQLKQGDKIEFFCVEANNKVTHHVLNGSLNLDEEYDTGVRCGQCLGNYYPIVSHKHRPPSSIYGPENCISTYLSPIGTCVVETTNCSDEAVTVTNVGFLCIPAKGAQVRHFFGINSFRATQKVDTGIKCDQCLSSDLSVMPGEEHRKDHVAFLRAKTVWMQTSVDEMVKEIEGTIHRLHEEHAASVALRKEKQRISAVLDVPPPKVIVADLDASDEGINVGDW